MTINKSKSWILWAVSPKKKNWLKNCKLQIVDPKLCCYEQWSYHCWSGMNLYNECFSSLVLFVDEKSLCKKRQLHKHKIPAECIKARLLLLTFVTNHMGLHFSMVMPDREWKKIDVRTGWQLSTAITHEYSSLVDIWSWSTLGCNYQSSSLDVKVRCLWRDTRIWKGYVGFWIC